MKKKRTYFKINYKNLITAVTVIPLVLVSVFVYLFISIGQVSDFYDDLNTRLEKISNNINVELDNAVTTSNAILTNRYILDVYYSDYENIIKKNIDAYTILDVYFSNYKISPYLSREPITVFHYNDSLFESIYSKRITDLEDTALKTLLENLENNETFWSNNGENIILYKKSNIVPSKTPLILRYSISHTKIENIINNLTEASNDKYSEDVVFGLESVLNTTENTLFSSPLLNGDRLACQYSPSVARKIYIHNLYFLLIGMALIIAVIIVFATFFSNTIKKRMDSFLCDLENNISINTQYTPHTNDFDELSPIYDKISSLMHQINQMHIEANKLKTEKAQMEINFLQAEINPHLLYNTLSVLKWDCMDKFPDSAEIIDTLVSYYRKILHNGQNIVTIRDEIELIKNYIEIVSYANSKNYVCNINVCKEVMSVYTFKLILQPFVENALLHGLFKTPNPTIDISGTLEEGYITLTVSDNGIGIEKSVLEHINSANYLSSYKSYGIRNTVKRLSLLYGDEGSVKIDSAPGCGTKVTIRFKNLSREVLENA